MTLVQLKGLFISCTIVAACCHKPHVVPPTILEVEKPCMDPLPKIQLQWPEPNTDGTTTLKPQEAQAVLQMVMYLRVQFERCGKKDP